jgi:hypothetical protein
VIEKRKIEGRWWVLGKPDIALYGVLEFDPDEGLHLETKEPRSLTFPEVFQPVVNAGGEPTIIGRDEHDKPVTLFFCSKPGERFSGGLKTHRYRVSYALLGIELKAWKDVVFHLISLELTHMQGWMGQSLFSAPKVEDGVQQVSCRLYKETPYRINENAGLKIVSRVDSQFSSAPEDMVKLVGKHYMDLEWKEPLHLEKANEWVLALCRLFSLSAGAPTYVRSLKGCRADHFINVGEQKIEQEIEVLRRNAGATSVEEKHHPQEMLFSFADVKDSFGDLFQRWLTYGEKLDAVLDLYFSVIFNQHLYLNHQFSFLAQALERYHAVQIGGYKEDPGAFGQRLKTIRQLMGDGHFRFVEDKLNWANEKTLFQRLTELVQARQSVIGDLASEFPEFPRLVKDTRNYYTHFDSSLLEKGKVAQRLVLVRLVEVMRIMLEVLFLDDLGIGNTAIQRAKKRRADSFMEIGGTNAP